MQPVTMGVRDVRYRRAVRTVVAWTLYPIVVIGSVAVMAFALDRGWPPLVVAPILVAIASATVHVLEQLVPHREAWRRPHGDVVTDLCHLVLSGGAAQLAQTAIVVGVAAVAAQIPAVLWPAAWPLVAQVLLAVVIYELGGYWLHRLQHERGLLWRLHAVHHSAPRLYWLTGARNHPLDLVAGFVWSATPLVLLGAGETVLVLAGTLAIACSTLQHANVDLRVGPFDRIANVVGVHRAHHSLELGEANANYGGMLLVWDHVFGTYRRPLVEVARVGLPGEPAFPPDYLGQIASPFTRSRRSAPRS